MRKNNNKITYTIPCSFISCVIVVLDMKELICQLTDKKELVVTEIISNVK